MRSSLLRNWCFRRGAYPFSRPFASCYAKIRSINIRKHDLKIFIPSFLALFSSAYSLTMLFPFLPFLIEFLLPRVKEEDIGKYAGFIASSLFLGRFFGSYVWGALADKKGRKPVVIISCVLIGVSSAAFGFSVKLYMAIIFRFLVGLFNGVVGTVKAIISESSNNRTQALGMSLIICSFSLGLIIGPAISGALADPIGQYNLTISDPVVRDFLTRFPFSLPCLVNTLICLLAAGAVAIWMPETLRTKREASVGGGSSSQSSSIAEDQEHLLLQNSASSDEHTSGVSASDSHTGYGPNSVTQKDGDCTTDTDIELQCREKNEDITPVTIEDSGHSRDEGQCKDESSGGVDCTKDGEKDAHAQGSSKRKGSLVPFYNRRSSFTPSFFKPARLFPHKRHAGATNYTSVHESSQRLVFEEDDENRVSSLPQQKNGEQDEVGGGRCSGEEEEIQVVTDTATTRAGRLCRSLKKTLQNLKLFLTTRGTLLSLLIYCIFSFALIGFDEVYSLWAASAPYLGGLGWTLHEIGISQAISGAIFLPFAFTFPVLERRFGLINVFQISAILSLICIVLLPNVHLISSAALNPLRWFLVILLLIIVRVNVGSVFAATALFINNSVAFERLGEVNGLAHSLTAILRSIAPVFSGSIFSISLSKKARHFGFPIDYHLIFIIFGIIILSCTALAAGLPQSINRQKVITSDSDTSINRNENPASSIRTEEEASTSSGNGEETSV